MEHKVNLTLDLPADPGRLWRRLDASVRNKVRKAERAGLSIEFGAAEKLTAFYGVFAARMRDLGSPVHSIGFLRAVLESFGDRARIALVRKGGMPIGGLVALAFKDRLVVPWATCLKDYFALGPNNLLYWETLRTACLAGVGHFDFGRSTRHSGTYDFKCQWGAREEPLFWYAIPIGRRRAQARLGTGRGAALLVGSWRRLPLAITRRVGPGIRKYLTQ
jgi:lipid II:glycine glycyltransferase (peptidoglycan interpeptide bridge formation enzyme)